MFFVSVFLFSSCSEFLTDSDSVEIRSQALSIINADCSALGNGRSDQDPFSYVDLTGDYASFATADDYVNYIKLASQYDQASLQDYVNRTASFETADKAFTNFTELLNTADAEDSTLTQSDLLDFLEPYQDVAKVVSSDGTDEITEKYPYYHPAYEILNRDGIIKVQGEYRLINDRFEHRSDDVNALIIIDGTVPPTGGGVTVDTVFDDPLDNRMGCNILDKPEEEIIQKDVRRCRRDRLLYFEYGCHLYKFKNDVDPENKFKIWIGYMKTRGLSKKKFAGSCHRFAYKTTLDIKNFNFVSHWEYSEFGQVIREEEYSMTKSDRILLKKKRVVDEQETMVQIPSSQTGKMTACWVKKNVDYSTRGVHPQVLEVR